MRFRSLVLPLFALFLALPACHHRRTAASHGSRSLDVSFTPYGVVRDDASTDTAVRFYEGDKQKLAKAGAQYVGELEVDAHGKKVDDRMWQRAAAEAARVGATHFLLVETGAPRGRFALFRVDPNRWNDLPEQLRPAMAGEPTSTTVVTSAPIR